MTQSPAVPELPSPLTEPHMDVRDLDGFMLNVERLIASELMAISTGDEFKASVSLWCRAWKQIPGGSLPNDERVLAAFSGNPGKWKKIREMALRGFILCSDGRLYHRTLCEDVNRAYLKKMERRDRTAAATEARKNGRNGKRDDQRDDQRDDERDTHVTTSQGQGQGHKKEDGDDAGATVVSISQPDHIAIGRKVARQCGLENDPSWFGDFGTVKSWMAGGADEALILGTVNEVLVRAGSNHNIRNLKYFTTEISRAVADRNSPLSSVMSKENASNVTAKYAEFLRKMGVEI